MSNGFSAHEHMIEDTKIMIREFQGSLVVEEGLPISDF